jgi:hypothetical protein
VIHGAKQWRHHALKALRLRSIERKRRRLAVVGDGAGTRPASVPEGALDVRAHADIVALETGQSGADEPELPSVRDVGGLDEFPRVGSVATLRHGCSIHLAPP